MTQYQITGFMIGIVLIGLFAGVFGIFISNSATSYGTTYDNTSLSGYDKMEEITAKTQAIQTGSTGLKTKTGVFDFVGGLFSDAYNVLLMTTDSVTLFDSMTNKAVSDANLGATGDYLRLAIGAIILIIIFVGIIISAVIRQQL